MGDQSQLLDPLLYWIEAVSEGIGFTLALHDGTRSNISFNRAMCSRNSSRLSGETSSSASLAKQSST
jgi:hypothetical protein